MKNLYYLDETYVYVGNCMDKTWVDNKIRSTLDLFL